MWGHCHQRSVSFSGFENQNKGKGDNTSSSIFGKVSDNCYLQYNTMDDKYKPYALFYLLQVISFLTSHWKCKIKKNNSKTKDLSNNLQKQSHFKLPTIEMRVLCISGYQILRILFPRFMFAINFSPIEHNLGNFQLTFLNITELICHLINKVRWLQNGFKFSLCSTSFIGGFFMTEMNSICLHTKGNIKFRPIH